jgi:hypothetical protein
MPRTTLSRRDVLRLAAALGLSFRLPGLDLRAAERRGGERAKSLIVMWLAGGPSQLETWDPHPGGKIGGPTQAIDTTIRGAQIAADYPKLAEQIHRLSIVRSLVSKEGDHERGAYFVKTGYRPDPTLIHPALGAIVAQEIPAPTVEIPTYIAMASGNRFPRAAATSATISIPTASTNRVRTATASEPAPTPTGSSAGSPG